MISLKDKVIVITGAGSGIGRALALRFAEIGAHLALCDTDTASLQQTSAEAKEIGSKVFQAKLDVSDRAEMESFAAKVYQHLGPADILINNAGVSLTVPVSKMELDDFDWLLSINLGGVVNGCQSFFQQLAERPIAYIINISSVFGFVGIPGQSAYCASKFAVRGFTEALQCELEKSSVKVILVHPGGVRTNIVRNGRHHVDLAGQITDAKRAAIMFDQVARCSPDQAAAKIIQGIYKNQTRILIGRDAYLFDYIARIFPASGRHFVNWLAEKIHQSLLLKLNRQTLNQSNNDLNRNNRAS